MNIMNINRWIALPLALVATAASAVTLTVTPANPTPADTLVLEVAGASSCASMVPNSLVMVDPRTIKVTYNDGANIQCLVAMPPPKVTLGRLPAGTYTVQLEPLNPNPASGASTSLTVVNSAGGPADPPSDNYSGLYEATSGFSDGVSVQQFGRTAFVTYLYHGQDGQTSWAVMPDAKWELAPGGGFRFRGAVWKTDVLPGVVGSGAGIITSRYIVGMGSFIPSGIFDEARLELELAGTSAMATVTLKRLRF